MKKKTARKWQPVFLFQLLVASDFATPNLVDGKPDQGDDKGDDETGDKDKDAHQIPPILVNGGVQNFIQPKRMGQRLKISPMVVFIGLFMWGFLLGGIGASVAVPMTMLVLLIMENFQGTRPLAILMRYTGDDEERHEALQHLRGTWEKLKGSFSFDGESKDTINES